jgi:hypothetical protein
MRILCLLLVSPESLQQLPVLEAVLEIHGLHLPVVSPHHSHTLKHAATCSDMSKPLPKWRRAVIEANSKFGCWVILKSVGMWMSIKGYENFEESRKMGCVSGTQQGAASLTCFYASAPVYATQCCIHPSSTCGRHQALPQPLAAPLH